MPAAGLATRRLIPHAHHSTANGTTATIRSSVDAPQAEHAAGMPSMLPGVVDVEIR